MTVQNHDGGANLLAATIDIVKIREVEIRLKTRGTLSDRTHINDSTVYNIPPRVFATHDHFNLQGLWYQHTRYRHI